MKKAMAEGERRDRRERRKGILLSAAFFAFFASFAFFTGPSLHAANLELSVQTDVGGTSTRTYTNKYFGTFILDETQGNATFSSLTFQEAGTVEGTCIDNVRLYQDTDGAYAGTESQFPGVSSPNNFSGDDTDLVITMT